jgi:sporulation-control protein spo0M
MWQNVARVDVDGIEMAVNVYRRRRGARGWLRMASVS